MDSKKEFASFKIQRVKEGIRFHITTMPEVEEQIKLLGELTSFGQLKDIITNDYVYVYGGKYSEIYSNIPRHQDELVYAAFAKGSSQPGGISFIIKSPRTLNQIKDIAYHMEIIFKNIYERIKPFTIEVRLVTCQ